MYDVYCEAFAADSNSFYPKPFEQWIIDKKGSGYDQSLWRMAYITDKMVGFIFGEK
jgi:hypothetical protein